MTVIAELRDLSVFVSGRSVFRNIGLEILDGERIGLFGPSGSGKSTLSKLLAGLLESNAGREISGIARVLGLNALNQSGAESLHGQVLLVPQQAATALPPHLTVTQLLERVEQAGIAKQALRNAEKLLSDLGFSDIDRVLKSLPTSLSGGERQRLVVALGMLRDPQPKLVILDEPTASLDPATKQQTAATILSFQEKYGFALIVVSHDRSILSMLNCPLLRLRDGRIDVVQPSELEARNLHLKSEALEDGSGDILLSLDKVTVRGTRNRRLLCDISLTITDGERVFITGPSGAGKTTLLKVLTGHLRPSSGSVLFRPDNRSPLSKLVGPRREIQPIFQDARSSFDPRLTIRTSLGLAANNARKFLTDHEINEVAESLSMPIDVLDRLPSEISGGECQRSALLRAVFSQPKILIADEPTANLDPDACSAVQLMLDTITAGQGTTLVAASHDEELVGALANRRVKLANGRLAG